MLRTLILKVGNMQEQMSNVSRDMKVLRQTQKEIQVIKNIVREMRNAFNRQIKERMIFLLLL